MVTPRLDESVLDPARGRLLVNSTHVQTMLLPPLEMVTRKLFIHILTACGANRSHH